MKPILFSIGLFLVTQSLKAQITITSADMPSTNDTIRVSNSNAVAAIDLSEGTNKTWDYSALIPISQDLIKYQSSLNTPYFFYFFNTYGTKIADSIGTGAFMLKDIYNFYKKSTSKFTAEGIGFKYTGIPLAANYTDEDELYQFPLNYGDVDSSTFAFSVSLPTIGDYSSQGYRKNEVVGWGTVQLPMGNFNCIMVKSIISSNDSITFQGTGFGFNNTRREIKFLANGTKIPVLQINQTALPGGGFVSTQIIYKDIFRNLTSTVALNKDWIQVYPNPANDRLWINGNTLENSLIKILDGYGRIVNTYLANTGLLNIDISQFAKGVYFVQMLNADGVFTQKWIKN